MLDDTKGLKETNLIDLAKLVKKAHDLWKGSFDTDKGCYQLYKIDAARIACSKLDGKNYLISELVRLLLVEDVCNESLDWAVSADR